MDRQDNVQLKKDKQWSTKNNCKKLKIEQHELHKNRDELGCSRG